MHARPTGARRLRAVVETLFNFYQAEAGFRVLWFSRFQSTAMLEVNRRHDLEGATGAYERLSRHGLDLVGVDPEHAAHLVIGIIDKGLDLAFRIDPAGDARWSPKRPSRSLPTSSGTPCDEAPSPSISAARRARRR